MDIGKPIRRIEVEPLELPAPVRPAEVPEQAPVEVPETEDEPVKK